MHNISRWKLNKTTNVSKYCTVTRKILHKLVIFKKVKGKCKMEIYELESSCYHFL